MGLFKKKVVKEISGAVWGRLVSDYGISVDTITHDIRCVERPGALEGKGQATFLRLFKPAEAERKGVVVTGWETFDEHPDLIMFEGYLTQWNEAHLEPKRV